MNQESKIKTLILNGPKIRGAYTSTSNKEILNTGIGENLFLS